MPDHLDDAPPPWTTEESAVRGDYAVFRVREDRNRSPRTGAVHPFYVIESPPWVNVIPLTPDGRVVFIRQYRHGTGTITLEVPGGMVDPGDASPAEAAARELREETGFTAARLVDLGFVEPNPAIQNNRCHTFLALDAVPDGAPTFDGTEDIATSLVDLADVPGLVASGRITHALVVTAFYLLDCWRAERREA